MRVLQSFLALASLLGILILGSINCLLWLIAFFVGMIPPLFCLCLIAGPLEIILLIYGIIWLIVLLFSIIFTGKARWALWLTEHVGLLNRIGKALESENLDKIIFWPAELIEPITDVLGKIIGFFWAYVKGE